MKSIKRCPECKQILTNNECMCGWEDPTDNGNCRDDLCAYRSHGRQCLYTGTSSSFPYGKATYYCTEHRENLGNIEKCEIILRESELNWEKRNDERIDWRRKLFSEDFSAPKKIK